MSEAKRVIIHWTAGGSRASELDRRHYHRLIEQDGNVVHGTHDIFDNVVTSDGDYAAHTRNLNTQSIGVSMCGMRGAVEFPFNAGPSPLTEKQFFAMCRVVGDLCREYGIPVTPQTVLTHAEVEPTLGVKQRGKWDITRLPFRSDLVGAIPVGNYIRETVAELASLPIEKLTMPTIRMGNNSPRSAVMMLQQDLASLGYHAGAADGVFGRRTRSAVLSFQADNGLTADGVVGPQTWAALETAKPAPIRAASVELLRKRQSGTIADADRAEKVAKAGTATVLGGISLDTVLDGAQTLSGAEGLLQAAQRVLLDNWAVLLAGGVAAFMFFALPKITESIRQRRLSDHTSGRNLGR